MRLVPTLKICAGSLPHIWMPSTLQGGTSPISAGGASQALFWVNFLFLALSEAQKA